MKTKGSALVIILIVLALLFAGTTAYLYIKSQQTSQTSPISQTTQTNSSDASLEPTGSAETANWKTYTSTMYGYSIKIPSDRNVVESDPAFVELGTDIVITASDTEFLDLGSFMESVNPATGAKNKETYALEKEVAVDHKFALATNGGCCGFLVNMFS